MRALEFIAGHVTFKLCYNKIYQLKTTLMKLTGIKIFQIYLLIKKKYNANVPLPIPIISCMYSCSVPY